MKNGAVFLSGLVSLTLMNVIAASLSAMHVPSEPAVPLPPAAPPEMLRLQAWPLPLPLPCGRWSLSTQAPPHPGEASFAHDGNEAW
jgi:hypothetical protein